MIISSVRVRREPGHDVVRVWNRGAFSGELIVQTGDGPFIADILIGEDAHVTLGEREDMFEHATGDPEER